VYGQGLPAAEPHDHLPRVWVAEWKETRVRLGKLYDGLKELKSENAQLRWKLALSERSRIRLEGEVKELAMTLARYSEETPSVGPS
jgi:hypothetical protein